MSDLRANPGSSFRALFPAPANPIRVMPDPSGTTGIGLPPVAPESIATARPGEHDDQSQSGATGRPGTADRPSLDRPGSLGSIERPGSLGFADPPRALKNQFIVGFTPGSTEQEREQALERLGAKRVRDLPLIDGAVVRIHVRDDAPQPRWSERTEGVVAWGQPDYVHPVEQVRETPITFDPRFAEQWNLLNTGAQGGVAGADIAAAGAWQLSTGKGVTVAVTDTSIKVDHPDLARNVWTNPREVAGNEVDDDGNGYVDDVHGYNFGERTGDPDHGAPYDHGTHVTGTIGAVANNMEGIAGVAPDATIMALPITGSQGSLTSNGIEAFGYAVANGVKVINASWGNNVYEPALAAAVQKLVERDVLLVVASGNESRDTAANPSYPDNYPGALSVAASTRRDRRWQESNYSGVSVDIAAPGGDILSTARLDPAEPYLLMSGTSMAAPHVAGVAALVKARYPELSMQQVADRILRSARRDGSARVWNRRVASGGRLDAEAALLPIATPGRPVVRGAQSSGSDAVRAGAAATIAWSADIGEGQRFQVEASTNAAAVDTVEETFERGRMRRRDDLRLLAGPGRNRARAVAGAGTNGSWGLRTPKLGMGHHARLDLHETTVRPTTLSFDVRASGAPANGAVSVFVDHALQGRPQQPTKRWRRVDVSLQPGEHDISIVLSRPERNYTKPVSFDIDNVRIDEVSAATWKPVGTPGPGATSIVWTPHAPTAAAAVRVRADNGRWHGPWVTSDQFHVDAPRAARR